jgi:hypothetical protein
MPLFLTCAACNLFQARQEPELSQQLPLSPPLGPPRRIVQEIAARWNDKQVTLLCVLELDKQHIAMAGLTKAGVTLFNLNYDGNKVSLRTSPLLPEHLPPEAFVKDLQLAFWPVTALQTSYHTPWRLSAENNRRRLFFNDDLISKVDYITPGEPWPVFTGLENRRYGYRLAIKTLSYETLPQ